MTFEIIALVCSLGQAPRDCQPDNARILAKIGEASTEMGCGVRSMLDAAKLPSIGADEYVKTVCKRREG